MGILQGSQEPWRLARACGPAKQQYRRVRWQQQFQTKAARQKPHHGLAKPVQGLRTCQGLTKQQERMHLAVLPRTLINMQHACYVTTVSPAVAADAREMPVLLPTLLRMLLLVLLALLGGRAVDAAVQACGVLEALEPGVAGGVEVAAAVRQSKVLPMMLLPGGRALLASSVPAEEMLLASSTAEMLLLLLLLWCCRLRPGWGQDRGLPGAGARGKPHATPGLPLSLPLLLQPK